MNTGFKLPCLIIETGGKGGHIGIQLVTLGLDFFAVEVVAVDEGIQVGTEAYELGHHGLGDVASEKCFCVVFKPNQCINEFIELVLAGRHLDCGEWLLPSDSHHFTMHLLGYGIDILGWLFVGFGDDHNDWHLVDGQLSQCAAQAFTQVALFGADNDAIGKAAGRIVVNGGSVGCDA